MKKRLTAIISLVILAAALPIALSACNKDNTKNRTLMDIYHNRSSYGEFTGSRLEITLPSGWSVYTADTNSDRGYIAGMNAFVVKKNLGGSLSIVKCGTNELILAEQTSVRSLRVKGNLISAVCGDGSGTVFNTDGYPVLSKKRIQGLTAETNVNDVIKILDDGLIAVNSKYEYSPVKDDGGNVEYKKTGITGYTSIFRPTTTGSLDSRGELVARVKNENDKSTTEKPSSLAYVNGFDGQFVSVTGIVLKDSGNKNVEHNRVFTIPKHFNGVEKTDSNLNGKWATNGQSDYYVEVTYIGYGRFYVHEDWTVDADEPYTYYSLLGPDGEKDGAYYKVERCIYSALDDTVSTYNSNIILMNLTNNYYVSDPSIAPGKDDPSMGNRVDVSLLLNPGFMYAAYGIVVLAEANGVKNVGIYDQFIVDQSLQVVMSLSGNFNIKLENQDPESVSAFDLLINFVDGTGYIPLKPSSMRTYDSKGNQIFSNSEYKIHNVSINSGMAVALHEEVEDDEKSLKYGAFDMQGNLKIPFMYTMLDPFRGFYTIAEREVEGEKDSLVVVGKDGVEYTKTDDNEPILGDIAKTASGIEIHKMGCYMYTVKVGDDVKYGIKSFNPNKNINVIMPATMGKGCTLYAPGTRPQDVFVFEKIGDGDNAQYKIYRLI